MRTASSPDAAARRSARMLRKGGRVVMMADHAMPGSRWIQVLPCAAGRLVEAIGDRDDAVKAAMDLAHGTAARVVRQDRPVNIMEAFSGLDGLLQGAAAPG